MKEMVRKIELKQIPQWVKSCPSAGCKSVLAKTEIVRDL